MGRGENEREGEKGQSSMKGCVGVVKKTREVNWRDCFEGRDWIFVRIWGFSG